MAVRYIGSKARLAGAILDIVGDPSSGSAHFVDAFCGLALWLRPVIPALREAEVGQIT